MRRKRLIWQLFPAFLLVTFLSLLAVTWYGARSWRQFYLAQTAEDLAARAHLAEPAGPEVFIRVKDQGCGIPAEHLDRIFERFYRVDAGRSRKIGGTGLGLAIVKHIAQAHGGRVAVESAPGKGSTFSIIIPQR